VGVWEAFRNELCHAANCPHALIQDHTNFFASSDNLRDMGQPRQGGLREWLYKVDLCSQPRVAIFDPTVNPETAQDRLQQAYEALLAVASGNVYQKWNEGHGIAGMNLLSAQQRTNLTSRLL
jgi:hypothetical protein